MSQAESQQELDTIQIAENSLTTVAREQKEVFMVMYQRFTQVLQSLLVSLSAQGRNPDEDWTYWWVHGWLKEALRLVSFFFFKKKKENEIDHVLTIIFFFSFFSTMMNVLDSR